MISRFSLIAIALALAAPVDAAEPAPGHPRAHSGKASAPPAARRLPYTPVVTPNGSTLPWEMEGGVKVFHLKVNAFRHEVSPGMVINAWGYNGQTPGPTIEAVEGDRVRIFVTNELQEPTAVHWHGVLLPNGMDGVQGLTQKGIPPGETYVYEFTLKQHGTQMYHSHGDEMTQIGMGTMGFFIIHPRNPRGPRIDRDFALFVNEWFVKPGSATPNISIMTDFNLFTFNSRAFPGTEPLVVRTGDRVRIRIGNVGQESHPIHLHGFTFKLVGTDGGPIPPSAQVPETTAVVFPGQTRDFEFVADAPGDWAMHCHRRHHPMNAMDHDFPNLIGVNQEGLEGAIREQLPNYMAMGEKGMHEMAEMQMHGPENTLPMMAGEGQFGAIGMGGMFTVLKVRDRLTEGEAVGQYEHPKGTVSSPASAADGHETSESAAPRSHPGAHKRLASPSVPGAHSGAHENPPTPPGTQSGAHNKSDSPAAPASPSTAAAYTCPMHPEVVADKPGRCPKCGMALVTKPKK